MPFLQVSGWAGEGGQSSRCGGGWPSSALEDQLLSEAALPLFQHLFVVFNGNAVSVVPLENFKSLLASQGHFLFHSCLETQRNGFSPSQHQEPINFTVTRARPQNQPRLQRPTAERLLTRQVALGSSSWLSTLRRTSLGCPLHPAGLGLGIRVTCGGQGWDVWSEEMKTRAPSPGLPGTSAKALSVIIQCHISPCFPVMPRLGFLFCFTQNCQALS